VPTFWLPKLSDEGATEADGDPGAGVWLGALPVRLTVGVTAESLATVNVAVADPPTVGLKLTVIVHEPFGRIGLMHVLVCVNSFEPDMPIDETVTDAVPVLVTLTN